MSAYNIKGRFAVVTGAGSVIIADIHLRPEAEATIAKYPKDALASRGAYAIFHKTDVSDWNQISSLWAAALEIFPHIDIVCNGAGVYEPPSSCFWNAPGVSPLAQDPVDAKVGQYKTFAVNTIGPIRLAQIAIDYWLQNRNIEGNLLWIVSLGRYVHSMHTPMYFASKAAIVSMVKSLGGLRKELGIRNAAVCPGAVYPEFGDGNVVETMLVGSKDDNSVSVREVPLHLLYPTAGPEGQDNHLLEEEVKMVKQLKKSGMRA
ncbi:hypothetical protein COL5a_008116 [Colletotrichum fioriniae]|uniref:uncharacterized protein n=1 Tax=Colletotrichum fioriniae TaxID=710243 RepID=UPI0032DA2904|nr:hypothetical protein COL5a_008116 [Colletotrichum fioriniae]KAJ3943320.1 hypothetical protein N0V96_006241 [Colletotrichum fioriniae]